MKIKKMFLLVASLFSAIFLNAQAIRIFFKSGDINDTASATTIAKISEPWGRFGNYVLVIDDAGIKTKYRKSEVWGYKRSKDDNIRRLFDKETYAIKEVNDDVAIYKRCVSHSTYFFSKGLDGPVIALTKEKLINAIGVDKFLKLYQHSSLVRQVTGL